MTTAGLLAADLAARLDALGVVVLNSLPALATWSGLAAVAALRDVRRDRGAAGRPLFFTLAALTCAALPALAGHP